VSEGLGKAPSGAAGAGERTLLWVLCAVQITHVMDFMVMMPLGPQLMRNLGMSPAQFGSLVASYGISAAVAGLAGVFFLDRLDRRKALLWAYAGFALATGACALAPGFSSLLIARIAAGACGGVAGSVLGALIADLVPGERRGAAMGRVQAAFPIASVLGVPVGLVLATTFSWHAPFILIVAVACCVWFVAHRIVPSVRPPPITQGLRRLLPLVQEPVHQRAFLMSLLLVFTGGCVIPFMAPSTVANAGLPESSLPLIYLCGGAVTFFTTPRLGRLTDRYDKFRLLAACTVLGSTMVFVVTHLRPVPQAVLLVVTTLFMLGMSSRFVPAMAMITNRIGPSLRGSFMSLNGSVQQLGAGAGAYVASLLVTTDPATGRLEGYAHVGYLSILCAGLTLGAARLLERAGPELHLAPKPAAPKVWDGDESGTS
jgi:MFS transporter, DHA1 family, inner membrane transport protein